MPALGVGDGTHAILAYQFIIHISLTSCFSSFRPLAACAVDPHRSSMWMNSPSVACPCGAQHARWMSSRWSVTTWRFESSCRSFLECACFIQVLYLFVQVWTDLKLGSLWTSIGTSMFDWEDSISLEEYDWRLLLNSGTIAAWNPFAWRFSNNQPNPWSSGIWIITSLHPTPT